MFYKKNQLCWMPVSLSLCLVIYIYITLHVYDIPKASTYEQKPNMEWTILLTVNNGYFNFFQNWYHYYRKLNLDYQLIVVAEDDIVYSKLQQLSGNLMKPERSSRKALGEAVVYGTKAFIDLASRRSTYILKHLKNGINIVFVDVDDVWLQNPVPYFNGRFDMWMQYDGDDSFCAGLMAIKSKPQTIKLIQDWEDSLKKHPQLDQNAFNDLRKESTVRLKSLDTNLFPSGKLYFEEFKDEQRKEVIIVHNNFIVGHSAKLQRFKQYKLWFS